MFFFAKDYNPVGKEINSKHKNQKLVEAMGRTTLSYPRSMGSILIISLAHSLVGIFISFAPKRADVWKDETLNISQYATMIAKMFHISYNFTKSSTDSILIVFIVGASIFHLARGIILYHSYLMQKGTGTSQLVGDILLSTVMNWLVYFTSTISLDFFVIGIQIGLSSSTSTSVSKPLMLVLSTLGILSLLVYMYGGLLLSKNPSITIDLMATRENFMPEAITMVGYQLSIVLIRILDKKTLLVQAMLNLVILVIAYLRLIHVGQIPYFHAQKYYGLGFIISIWISIGTFNAYLPGFSELHFYFYVFATPIIGAFLMKKKKRASLKLLTSSLSRMKKASHQLSKLQTLHMIFLGRKTDPETYFGYILHHRASCKDEFCYFHDIITEMKSITEVGYSTNIVVGDSYYLFLDFLTKEYVESIRKFPDNMNIRISFGYFLLDQLDKKELALEITHSSERKEGIDYLNKYQLFKLRYCIESKLERAGMSRTHYHIEDMIAKVDLRLNEEIESTTESAKNFWKSLESDSPKLEEVTAYMNRIGRKIIEIEALYMKSKKKISHIPKLQLRYAGFTIFVLNNLQTGINLIAEAKRTMQLQIINAYKLNSIETTNDLSLCSKPLAILFLKKTEIIFHSVNQAFAAVFLTSKEKLRNTNLLDLVPHQLKYTYWKEFSEIENMNSNTNKQLLAFLLRRKTRIGLFYCEYVTKIVQDKYQYIFLHIQPDSKFIQTSIILAGFNTELFQQDDRFEFMFPRLSNLHSEHDQEYLSDYIDNRDILSFIESNVEGDEDNKKISILSECFYSKDFTVDVELTRYPRNSPPLFFIRFTLRGTANYEINLTPWMFKQHKGEPTFCLELDPMLMIYRGRLILNSDKTSLAETVKDSERRRSRRLQMEPLKALRQSRFFHFFPGLTDYAEGITTLTLNRDGTLDGKRYSISEEEEEEDESSDPIENELLSGRSSPSSTRRKLRRTKKKENRLNQYVKNKLHFLVDRRVMFDTLKDLHLKNYKNTILWLIGLYTTVIILLLSMIMISERSLYYRFIADNLVEKSIMGVYISAQRASNAVLDASFFSTHGESIAGFNESNQATFINEELKQCLDTFRKVDWIAGHDIKDSYLSDSRGDILPTARLSVLLKNSTIIEVDLLTAIAYIESAIMTLLDSTIMDITTYNRSESRMILDLTINDIRVIFFKTLDEKIDSYVSSWKVSISKSCIVITLFSISLILAVSLIINLFKAINQQQDIIDLFYGFQIDDARLFSKQCDFFLDSLMNEEIDDAEENYIEEYKHISKKRIDTISKDDIVLSSRVKRNKNIANTYFRQLFFLIGILVVQVFFIIAIVTITRLTLNTFSDGAHIRTLLLKTKMHLLMDSLSLKTLIINPSILKNETYSVLNYSEWEKEIEWRINNYRTTMQNSGRNSDAIERFKKIYLDSLCTRSIYTESIFSKIENSPFTCSEIIYGGMNETLGYGLSFLLSNLMAYGGRAKHILESNTWPAEWGTCDYSQSNSTSRTNQMMLDCLSSEREFREMNFLINYMISLSLEDIYNTSSNILVDVFDKFNTVFLWSIAVYMSGAIIGGLSIWVAVVITITKRIENSRLLLGLASYGAIMRNKKLRTRIEELFLALMN